MSRSDKLSSKMFEETAAWWEPQADEKTSKEEGAIHPQRLPLGFFFLLLMNRVTQTDKS